MATRLSVFFIVLGLQNCLCLQVLYVDGAGDSSAPTGSLSAPYRDLSQALASSADPDLQLVFGNSTSQVYDFSTLGMHAFIDFQCAGNTINVVYPILVGPGVLAQFENCVITSGLPPAAGFMMAVFGNVEFSYCTLKGLSVKGFVVYGLVQLRYSTITQNSDSIFAAPIFGFQIYVQNCLFEMNASPVGTIAVLSLSGTSFNSSTVLSIDASTFIGNGAYMGGSILYLSVGHNIPFTQSQLEQMRVISIKNCLFNTNPGYLYIIYSKYTQIVVSDNTFLNHDYVFVIQLYDSSVLIAHTSVQVVARFLIVTYLAGFLQVQGLSINTIVEGPGILINNQGSFGAGAVLIEDVEMWNVTLTDTSLFSSSLLAVRVEIEVRNMYVHLGSSFTCGGGCFIYSAATLQNITVENMVIVQGALVSFLASNGDASDLNLRNITLTGVGMAVMMFSTVNYQNTMMRPGPRGYLLKPHPLYNVFVCYFSAVNATDGYFDLPPISNVVAFYLWQSNATMSNMMFPTVFSNIADLYMGSNLLLSNLSIGYGYFDNLFFNSFQSIAILRTAQINNTQFTAQMFSVLSDSVVDAQDIALNNVQMLALVSSANSQVRIANINIERVQAGALFLNNRMR